MSARNCMRCGKVFLYMAGNPLCPACVEIERTEFASVRGYLRRHPNAGIVEVSQATGVPVSKIRAYIREGKLVSRGEDWGVQCDTCGASIERGRYCKACSADLEKQIQKSTGSMFVEGRRLSYRPGKKVMWDRFRRR